MTWQEARKEIKQMGRSQISIARDLSDLMSHRTVERFFGGLGISKSNEQIIINHIQQLKKR